MIRLLWHWENLPEKSTRFAVATNASPLLELCCHWLAYTSHNLVGITYVYQLKKQESWLKRDYLCLPIEKILAMIWSSLLTSL